RLDQEKGPSTPFQRPPYHSALIPGTRRVVLPEQYWSWYWRIKYELPHNSHRAHHHAGVARASADQPARHRRSRTFGIGLNRWLT
ncbi:hypothetical protein, partial [Bradyrhizobium liaoningense]|uniref:hypothetical protein n=1 Tax=Bradyrhizobium liaoningense TaxID=43992 RepID=UPI001BA55097